MSKSVTLSRFFHKVFGNSCKTAKSRIFAVPQHTKRQCVYLHLTKLLSHRYHRLLKDLEESFILLLLPFSILSDRPFGTTLCRE